jgi:CPA2 family monovalent cation:H+ antiporter-2
MQRIDLIQDFTILLLAAGAAALICKRLGLSAIVGFLVAGIIIGPHTPPFSLVTDEQRVMALSQVGLVFLMFSIGLGLSVSKFARLGAGTLVATVTGALAVLVLTEAAGALVGWTPLQAMFVAAMLMVSSSAVIAKIIAEQKLAHERSSQIALAVTVLEDVVAVAMLTLLASQVAVAQTTSPGLGKLLGGLSAFVVLLVGGGLLLIPRLMRRLEIRAEPEIQTLIVAGLMCGLALTAAKAGYSTALGAFLFGAIVAEIPQKAAVEESFRGLRDLFSSVFFVSIGMMINLKLLTEVWPLILAVTVFALFVRPLACGLALVFVGTPPADARRAALLLTPLGEFSFIIAQLGVGAAVLAPSFYPVAVGASILTILATPTVNRHRTVIVRAWETLEPRFVTRVLDAYHAWLMQVRKRPARTPLWSLLRPRLGQIGIEVLFVSGVLVFGELIVNRLARAPLLRELDPPTLGYVFWSAVALVVLVPLVAIWRNVSALAMLVGECWESGRLPRSAIERTLSTLAALGLATWLYVLLPHARFPQWGWLAIAAGAALVVAGFSRRLVFWHSDLVGSVRDVLADRRADLPELRQSARTSLGEDLGEWDVAMTEAVLPESSVVAGKTLAELALPSRFGCAVIEVERNGRPIRTPRADFAVSCGDRLLLVGAAEQLTAAQTTLEHGDPSFQPEHDFARLVLDTGTVPDAYAGFTLGELGAVMRARVRVVGIQRGEHRIISPSAGERIHSGDDLLLLGTLEAIRRFRHDLSSQRPEPVSAR